MSGNLTPPPERAFPAGRLQLRKEQLVSTIHAQESPRLAASLNRQQLAFGAAGFAAVAFIAVAVVLLGTGGAGPSPAAAAVLRHAARTAAQQPATDPPAPGQFVYTKSDSTVVNTAAFWAGGLCHGCDQPAIKFFERAIRELWIAPDGSGRIREVDSPPSFFTSADRDAWVAAGEPDLTRNRNASFQSGELEYLDVSKLPSDPGQLKQLIEDRQVEDGPPGDAETFTIIGDLLRETYAPPAVRSSLYTIASQLPGVELVGRVHDQLGRSGIAVAYTSQGIRAELIFDPQTSALLADQRQVVGNGRERVVASGSSSSLVPLGTVLESTTYVSSGIVNSTSATVSATR